MKRGGLLAVLILLGLAGGTAVGHLVLYDSTSPISGDHWMRSAGELLLVRPLMLLVAPLVLASVVVAAARIRELLRLGVVAGAALLYFLATMMLAVALGTALAAVVRPGDGISPERAARMRAEGTERYIAHDVVRAQIEAEADLSIPRAWRKLVQSIVPSNFIGEMVAVRPLGLIVISILLGMAIAAGGARTAAAHQFFEALLEALIIIVRWILWLAPAGVFLLTAWTIGRSGLAGLWGPLSTYVAVVLGGLLIHGLVVLPLILLIFGRANPLSFLWSMKRALFVAFGTSSSAATLPVALESASSDGGCSMRAAGFVLPAGTSVNLNGTALFAAAAVCFLFQLYGISLDWPQLLVVAITAALAAIGAAGVPAAGLFAMALVIMSVNTTLPADQSPVPMTAIGVILALDRIVDMFRTAVNVWGNAVGAKIMTKLVPEPQ
jgi:Na+/H+-dicarboxylate symporter